MKKKSTTSPDTNKIQQEREEIPESSRHLQQLYDEMPSGYALHEIICDLHGKPVDYRFLEMNSAFEKQTGMIAGEVLGKRALEVIPGLEPYWIETYGRVALTGQPERFENYSQALHKTFSVIAYCPQPGQFAVLFEDVTGRKQTEQKLKESVGNMQAILDSNLDAVFLIELDGTIVAANQALAGRFGRNRADLIGSNTYDLVDKNLSDHRRKFMDQVISTGKPTRLEDERDGLTIESSIYPVLDEQGKVVRLAIFSRDVSERKKAEEQILRSEEELKKAQSYAHAGSWVWDIKAGSLEWSDEMFNIFGISKENFSGNLQDVVASAIHPDDREKVEASNSSVAHQGKPIPLEYRILRPDGSERVVWAEAGELEKDAEGNPALLRGIVMDITESKHAQTLLHESEERLRLSTELADVAVWEFNFLTNRMSRSTNHDSLYGLEWQTEWMFETFLNATHPKDREYSNEIIQRSADIGGPDEYQFDFRVVYTDGSIHWLSVIGQIFERDLEGKAITARGSLIDITERKQAEVKQTQTLELLTNLSSLVPGVIYQYQLHPDGSSTFPYSSPGIFNIYEVTPEQVKEDATPVFGRLHPEDADRVSDLIFESARTLDEFYCEFRVILPEQGLRWRWSQAHPERTEDGGTLWHGIISDITDRKLAEEELREERQRLAGILEGTNAGTWEWNVQTGETIFNERWAEIIGYSLDEISPISIETWIKYAHPDDLKVSDELLQKHFSGEMDYYEFESRMKHKDGSWVWVLDRGKVISWTEDGKPLIMMGTHQDITERKRAEEALQKSQDLLNATGKMAKVGGWEIDTSGITLAWTEETFQIHELAPGSQPDVAGAINFYHPDDRERVASAVEQAIATGQPFDFEARLITARGNQIWVRLSSQSILKQGKLVGVRGSIQNITDRKLAEEALQQSEQRYRERATELETIMDIAPVALWMAQDPACHVIVGNRIANELHRIQPDQNASLTPAKGQLLKPDQLKILHDGVEITANELPLQMCASKGIEIRDFESQIVFEDGSVVHEIGNAKPLLDENGQLRGAVGAFMDVTGLKRVEEELRHRAEELDALQKTVFDITAAQTLPGLLESIVERACQLVGAPGGGLYMADPVRQEVRCDVSYNTPGNYVGVVLKYGEGIAGRVAQTGQPFSVDDYKNWAGRAQSFELERPFSTVLGVPMLWGSQVHGVIDVLHFEEGRSFSQADMNLLNIFAGHAAIAIENSRLLEASQAGEAQVRILSTRLAEAEENERRRIARELHDQVGQSLSALSINMNIMHSQVPEYLPGFKRRLDDSLMLIDQTTDHIRHLMSELRPAVLDDYGLKAALDWAVGSIAKRTSLKLQVEGECNRFPSRVEIALFRIAQEALGNITRHAHARNVKVMLAQDGSEMSMAISDDGVGFDPASVEATEKSGWGLRLMAERAESIRANLQVESTPGIGTCITVRYHDDNSTGG